MKRIWLAPQRAGKRWPRKRTVYPSAPASVEYELSEAGASLVKPMGAVSNLGVTESACD